MAPPVVTIRDIAAHENQEVELRGWLYNKRSSGKLHFLQIRDGSGVIQAVVFKNDVPPEQFTRAEPVFIMALKSYLELEINEWERRA